MIIWISPPPFVLPLRKMIVKRKRDIDVPFCYRLEYNIENGHEREREKDCLDNREEVHFLPRLYTTLIYFGSGYETVGFKLN